MKNKIILILSTFLSLSLIGCLFVRFLFVIPERYSGEQAIGMIDYHFTEDFGDIVAELGAFAQEHPDPMGGRTHGDEMLSFFKSLQADYPIYFYAADDAEGIGEEGILAGLDWMESRGVKNINISLSTKQYSEKIQKWILEHPDTRVYASYNNRLNTVADYPAMYKGVIASGSDGRIPYKESDQRYASGRVLVSDNGLKVFEGNSFLSLVTVLSKTGE